MANPIKTRPKVDGRRCRRCRGRQVVPIRDGRGVEPCLRCGGTGIAPERIRVFFEIPDTRELLGSIDVSVELALEAESFDSTPPEDAERFALCRAKLLRCRTAIASALSRYDEPSS